MLKLFLWVLLYTFVLAFSQILLKLGVNQIGAFSVKNVVDAFGLSFSVLKNPYLLLGAFLMASSFFLWITILSWFKLNVAFPLTALTYVFVALLAYVILGERLSPYNYLGIVLIAAGIFFLLFKIG